MRRKYGKLEVTLSAKTKAVWDVFAKVQLNYNYKQEFQPISLDVYLVLADMIVVNDQSFTVSDNDVFFETFILTFVFKNHKA